MSEVQKVEKSATPSPETDVVMQPAVDICEDTDGISLWVDMPGVSRDRLDIQVDRDTLVIEGHAQIDTPEGIKPIYADVRSTRYRRSFALSSELDTDQIEATMTDGVLNLRIHKRAESKPRKIEVATH
jgi:HSP20 family molecular chaperone IbpA